MNSRLAYKEFCFTFGLLVIAMILSKFLLFAGDSRHLSILRDILMFESDLPFFLSWFFNPITNFRDFVTDIIRNFIMAPTNYFYSFSKFVVIGPFLEEVIWRGPLFVTMRYRSNYWWIAIAVTINTLFVIAHPYSVYTLLVIAFLAAASTMLIVRTGKFWPSVSLHMLYNTKIFLS